MDIYFLYSLFINYLLMHYSFCMLQIESRFHVTDTHTAVSHGASECHTGVLTAMLGKC